MLQKCPFDSLCSLCRHFDRLQQDRNRQHQHRNRRIRISPRRRPRRRLRRTTTSSTTAAGDKIGVPECDDFIAKYEACVSGKVPEVARAQFQSMLKTWRTEWKKAADNPQTKAALAQGCKMSAEQANASMKAYGCSF